MTHNGNVTRAEMLERSVGTPGNSLSSDLQQLRVEIKQAAEARAGDCLALLELLRLLEEMHRQVQDEEFQAALPTTRRSLYALLQDIEEKGSWPHLPRIQIQMLFNALRE